MDEADGRPGSMAQQLGQWDALLDARTLFLSLFGENSHIQSNPRRVRCRRGSVFRAREISHKKL